MSSSGRKPLTLKGSSGASTVRQSLSHSRTKAVVVEKKRKRVISPKDPAEKKAAEAAKTPAAASGAGQTAAQTAAKTAAKAPAAKTAAGTQAASPAQKPAPATESAPAAKAPAGEKAEAIKADAGNAAATEAKAADAAPDAKAAPTAKKTAAAAKPAAKAKTAAGDKDAKAAETATPDTSSPDTKGPDTPAPDAQAADAKADPATQTKADAVSAKKAAPAKTAEEPESATVAKGKVEPATPAPDEAAQARPAKAATAKAAPASARAANGAAANGAAAQRAARDSAQGAAARRNAQGNESRGRKGGGKGVVLKTLTEEEKQKRAAALSMARVREVEDRKRAAEDAVRRAEEDKRRAKEREEAAKREAEEAERRKKTAEAKRKAEEEAKRREADEAQKKAADASAVGTEQGTTARRGDGAVKKTDQDELERVKRRAAAEAAKPATARKGEQRRRSGKLTITQALDDDGNERTRSLAAVRRAREREKRRQMAANQQPQKIVREVVIPERITVQELANRMATRAVDIIKVLMKQGVMAKMNDVIDSDTAQIIAEEDGHTVKRVSEADVEEGIIGGADDEAAQKSRAPVVTIMGHVDHGKTSLLDALRETDVVSGEAGGITQHIGAYQVTMESGEKISFLDTPGHAAFTSMRARGAKVTDIVILVVAADDGVMPQTAEAISHAKAAEVPIIVAINKIDKPDANPDRVRQDLLQHDLVVESMGGDIQDIEVSALKKMNLDALEEAIILQSEILELKANPDRSAEGVVIEAKLDRGRGPVGTVLIQRGTLKVGDIFVAGSEWGKVRALINDKGNKVDEGGPSVPVEILGFNGTPEAGDVFAVVDSEARAREISEYRQRKRRESKVGGAGSRGSLEQMLAQLKETDKKEFPVLIKGDVQGSVEAILGALNQLSTDEVAARPIHSAVGGITESDVILAQASNCPIIAFNVRANRQARDLASQDGVEIRYYSVIYDLVDDVKAAMSGLLDPTLREHFIGNAEILEVFNISKVGKVAGCRVTEGSVRRGAKVRLIRDNVVIHEGTLSTLKRFKDEVKEVHGGQECGMAFENYQDLQVGDVIECFEVEEIQRTL